MPCRNGCGTLPSAMPRKATPYRFGVGSVIVSALLSAWVLTWIPSPHSDEPPVAQVMMGGEVGMVSGTMSSVGGDFGNVGTMGMSSTGGNTSSMDMIGGDKGGAGGNSVPPMSSSGGVGGDMGDMGNVGALGNFSSEAQSSSRAPGSSAAPPQSSSALPPASSSDPPPSSSSAASRWCGDGRTDAPETCDPCSPVGRVATDPNCNAVCSVGRCGDGFLDRRRGEECDYVGLVFDAASDPSVTRDESTFGRCASDASCGDGYCLYGQCWPLKWIAYWNWSDVALCPQTWSTSTTWTLPNVQTGSPCNDFTDPRCREFSGDGCTISCKLERCGDRIVQAGYTNPAGKHYGLSEQCDDGNTDSGDGCSDRCQLESGSSAWGVPLVSSSAASSSAPPSSVLASSQEMELICGDGILSPGEECDDGDQNSATVSGACRLDCRRARCGDFVADYILGEQCDQGVGNSDVTPDRCRTACKLPRCGDAVVDTGETCDDGNSAAGDGCSPFCIWESLTQMRPSCGDARMQSGETCDDGNTVSGDGCSSLCQAELVLGLREEINPMLVTEGLVCGDGVLSPGEACDDGNPFGGDGCSPICALESSVCGDGVLAAGEQCDPPGPTCSQACTLIADLKSAADLPPPLPLALMPYAFVALPPTSAPIADTGPAAIAVMASGAAAAVGWLRRKKVAARK